MARDDVTADAAAMAPRADEEIEGGYVAEIPDLSFDERKHRARTASRLAIAFACIFAGALLLHYAAFVLLAWHGQKDALAGLSDTLNVWLPAMTGIVSAAATYYFTKER